MKSKILKILCLLNICCVMPILSAAPNQNTMIIETLKLKANVYYDQYDYSVERDQIKNISENIAQDYYNVELRIGNTNKTFRNINYVVHYVNCDKDSCKTCFNVCNNVLCVWYVVSVIDKEKIEIKTTNVENSEKSYTNDVVNQLNSTLNNAISYINAQKINNKETEKYDKCLKLTKELFDLLISKYCIFDKTGEELINAKLSLLSFVAKRKDNSNALLYENAIAFSSL